MNITQIIKALEAKGMLKLAMALFALTIGAGTLGTYILIQKATGSNSVYEGGMKSIIPNPFRSDFSDIEGVYFGATNREWHKRKYPSDEQEYANRMDHKVGVKHGIYLENNLAMADEIKRVGNKIVDKNGSILAEIVDSNTIIDKHSGRDIKYTRTNEEIHLKEGY